MRAAYAELRVSDLDASERFYVRAARADRHRTTDDALYLRGWEERLTTRWCCAVPRSPAAARLGFRVRHESDLDLIEADLAARGLAPTWAEAPEPGVGRVLRVWDPFGYPLEFFHEMEQFETQLQRFDLHRGAPILRFDHLNLHVPTMRGGVRVLVQPRLPLLGVHLHRSPRMSGMTGVWLSRKPSVHDIALTAGRGPRLAPLRILGRRAGRGAARLRPARRGVAHATRSSAVRDAMACRTRSSSTCAILMGTGSSCTPATTTPATPITSRVRWSVNDPRCRSFWGTRAPDSWYEESSSIVGPDGEIVPTQDASVDERDHRTEVMA